MSVDLGAVFDQYALCYACRHTDSSHRVDVRHPFDRTVALCDCCSREAARRTAQEAGPGPAS